MDDVFKFENFDLIEEVLNEKLSRNIKLEKLNSSPRSEYQNYYNKYSISVVKKIYKKDLEMFDYRF